MRSLLRLVAWRYLKATPGRTFLTLFGIVLGVAVIFAIEVVNASVLASFESTVDDIAGKTALQVGGDGSGVEESLLDAVKGTDGVAAAVPVIVETARHLTSGTQFAVLGVDTLSDSEVRDYEVTADDVTIEDEIAFLNDPRGVLVTREFAARTGTKVGDALALSTSQGNAEFTVRGLLSARGPAKVFGGDLLVMDVFAAQIAFGKEGRFDRIDVVPAEGQDVPRLASRLEEAVRGMAAVGRPQRRTEEAERILAGFRMGLSLASLVAIFVGGFIVYNALAIAVAQRRREIGILRALGATRTQILGLFVGEGLLMGAAGSLLGVVAGLFLARAVLGVVGTTISDLYLRVKPDGLALTPGQLALGVAAGVLASVIASFFPARRAAAIEPASAMRRKLEAADLTLASVRTTSLVGVGLLLGAVALAWVANVRQSFGIGYAVAGVLAFAAAFLSPALARAVGGVARRVGGRLGPIARLAADGFDRNAGRNAVTIAALGMALANVLIIAGFIGSMKGTIESWFERSIRSDLFVFSGREVKAKFEQPFPAEVGEHIRGIPGVEFVNDFRMVKLSYRGEPFYLLSHHLREYAARNEIPVVDGDLEEALDEIDAGRALAASEGFARIYGVKRGDVVRLQTPEGPRDFAIAMIYVDYTADIGLLSTTRDVYTRIWKDPLVDSSGVYLEDGADPLAARRAILARWGPTHDLMVLENSVYRREIMALIDRSFTLTYAMELVAIIVAVLGIVNTLLVAVIDRRMEIGILKAIGAAGPQVRRMFVAEAGLIGLSATILGVGLGSIYSVYIVEELMRFQTGWDMHYRFPWVETVQVLVMAQVVAWAGAWWPARGAARLDVVDALEYE